MKPNKSITKISTTQIPRDSILEDEFQKIDFKDAYSFLIRNNNLTLQELYIAIFSKAPKWLEYLMSLRNRIVRVFGLKTEMKKNTNTLFKIGDKVGLFKIYHILEDEIIAGEDDRHLDFRVSMFREINEDTKITVSTLVKYNNRFGWLYFAIISPFHKLAVKSLLKKAAKSIENND